MYDNVWPNINLKIIYNNNNNDNNDNNDNNNDNNAMFLFFRRIVLSNKIKIYFSASEMITFSFYTTTCLDRKSENMNTFLGLEASDTGKYC